MPTRIDRDRDRDRDGYKRRHRDRDKDRYRDRDEKRDRDRDNVNLYRYVYVPSPLILSFALHFCSRHAPPPHAHDVTHLHHTGRHYGPDAGGRQQPRGSRSGADGDDQAGERPGPAGSAHGGGREGGKRGREGRMALTCACACLSTGWLDRLVGVALGLCKGADGHGGEAPVARRRCRAYGQGKCMYIHKGVKRTNTHSIHLYPGHVYSM